MSTYQLIDSGQFRKLERVGEFTLARPAASAVWDPGLSAEHWKKIDAEFIRHRDGSGEWKIQNPKIEQAFLIDVNGLKFQIKLTSFGHLGIFPEQRENWHRLESWVRQQSTSGREVRVLNLFAYTGGSSLACARGGAAEVAHVDASKGTVRWAGENAKASGLGESKIRWLVDDVQEFVARELRRGSLYDAIILDPPSFGKGEKKQIWKIEKDLMPLLRDCRKLLNKGVEVLVCLSAHSEGYSPVSLSNQLMSVLGREAQLTSEEMLIIDQQERPLPSGASAVWIGQS